MRACYLCKRKHGQRGAECRPYGPRGEDICFDCAMAPNNKASTEQMFAKTLDACGDVAVLRDGVIRPATEQERMEIPQ